MIWQFSTFDSLSDESLKTWQTLNERHFAKHPGLDGRFMGLLLQHFGDGDELIAIATDNDEPVAGAIVKKVGWGIWSLYVPGQGCLAPWVCAPNEDAASVVLSLQRAIPGFCWLLRLPKVDPEFQPIDSCDAASRLEIAEYGTTYAVRLDGTFEDYWSKRSKGLRYKIRRAIRDIDKAGMRMSLTSRTATQCISDGVRVHAELESAGWKGERGSAIGAQDRQGAFYEELLRAFANENLTHTYQLNFDDQPVASLLCIANGKMAITLKTAYREEHAKLAPGRLIDYLVYQELMSSAKYEVMEMYTRASPSDLSWASTVRKTVGVNVFRYGLFKQAASLVRRIRRLAACLRSTAPRLILRRWY